MPYLQGVASWGLTGWRLGWGRGEHAYGWLKPCSQAGGRQWVSMGMQAYRCSGLFTSLLSTATSKRTRQCLLITHITTPKTIFLYFIAKWVIGQEKTKKCSFFKITYYCYCCLFLCAMVLRGLHVVADGSWSCQRPALPYVLFRPTVSRKVFRPSW